MIELKNILFQNGDGSLMGPLSLSFSAGVSFLPNDNPNIETILTFSAPHKISGEIKSDDFDLLMGEGRTNHLFSCRFHFDKIADFLSFFLNEETYENRHEIKKQLSKELGDINKRFLKGSFSKEEATVSIFSSLKKTRCSYTLIFPTNAKDESLFSNACINLSIYCFLKRPQKEESNSNLVHSVPLASEKMPKIFSFGIFYAICSCVSLFSAGYGAAALKKDELPKGCILSALSILSFFMVLSFLQYNTSKFTRNLKGNEIPISKSLQEEFWIVAGLLLGFGFCCYSYENCLSSLSLAAISLSGFFLVFLPFFILSYVLRGNARKKKR